MDLDKFKGSDKYSAFLWGNNGLTKVINENISEERKGSSILIFKDSYANSFIQFLSYNYEIIDIIFLLINIKARNIFFIRIEIPL